MNQPKKSFFENKLKSWFFNTPIKNHQNIQNLILEYAFDLKNCLNFAKVNSEGRFFYQYFKKFILEKIKNIEILKKQTWMNSNPNLWLCWLLTKKEDTKFSEMIPLDPKITMNILFNMRTLYPISYKARILKDLCGEIYFNVTLSAISISNKKEKIETSNYLSIYDMLLSNNIIFGVDLVFSRPYDISEITDSGGGDIVISIHPEHIFEILCSRNFVEYLNNCILFNKNKFTLGDWSNYFDKKVSKLVSGKLIKSEILTPKMYLKLSIRNPFPFIPTLISSFVLQNRKIEHINKSGSLYNISINILDNTINTISNIDFSLLDMSAIKSCPNLAFFMDSSLLNENSLQIIIDSINFKEKELFIDKNLENSEEIFETNQLNFDWNNIEENSPLFKDSYKNRHKPPWRTSIDCIINAIQEKQSKIISLSQQPSINFGHRNFKNERVFIEEFQNDFSENLNGDMDIANNQIEETNAEFSVNCELDEINSPSLVTSGFVMGVRCLPASTAVTSLGSIISHNNSNFSNRNACMNRNGNQNQRLSIPFSDRTGRISSCPTFSSIATSWGTPVPITRTIPIDDILGRQKESIQNNNLERDDNNEQYHSEIRLKCNLSSEDEEFYDQKEYKVSQEIENILLESLDNLEINNLKDNNDSDIQDEQDYSSDISITAKETLKSWKYINCELGEMEYEEQEENTESEFNI